MSDLATDQPSTLENWQAIANLARALADVGEPHQRQALIRDTCLRCFGVGEVEFYPIHRNLADMADRPGKGRSAFLEYLATLGQPVGVSVGDVEGLAQRDSLPAILTAGRYRSFLFAPVTLPGRAVGVLLLADEAEREFSEQDLAMLQALLPQIAGVLDSAILSEEAAYKDAYARALGELDTMIATYDVAQILRFGVRKVYETIDAEKVLIFIVNPDSGAVRLSVAEGCPYARDPNLSHEPCAKLAMQALRSRKLQQLEEGEIQQLAGVRLREACTEKQAIAVPIMANNSLFGVLEVFEKRNGLPFHRNEVAFVNQVATKLALVIQNTQAYITINRLNEGLEEKVRERTVQLEGAITSLKTTQLQLMQTEKLATIGTLAGGVAHEINNPLAAILANVQLLRLDIEDEEQLESLAIIETGAQRCKSIVEHLLNYARQAAPEHRSVSLSAVIDESLEMLQHRIKQAGVVIEREYAELPPVLGNLNELGQVVTNLVVNALDAIGERPLAPGQGRLRIRTRLEGKAIVADFIDNGCGIDDRAMRQIFDPFFTTKQVGKGTGLGLSVSQQIMATHGGRLEATSRPGEGSTFSLIIPVAHGAAGTGKLPGQGAAS